MSVLIPVHNQAQLLVTCLGSVLSQRFVDFDVLVAGDGCTDDSERIVRGVADPRVRWLGFPKAPGFGYANRARALATAAGDLVAYCSPDDLWAPDHLQTLVGALHAGRFDLVFSRPVMVGRDGELEPHYFAFDLLAGGPTRLVGPRLWFLSPTQALHRRSLLERAGGWDGQLRQFGDVDLWQRCRAVGARMAFLNHPTVVRLPAIRFRATSPAARARLHARLGQALLDGRLELAGHRWPLARRAAAGSSTRCGSAGRKARPSPESGPSGHTRRGVWHTPRAHSWTATLARAPRTGLPFGRGRSSPDGRSLLT